MVKGPKESKERPKKSPAPKTPTEEEVEENSVANPLETMRAKVEKASGKQVKVESSTPHPPGEPKLLGLLIQRAHPRITFDALKEDDKTVSEPMPG